MPILTLSAPRLRPTIAYIFLVLLLGVLWIAGGSSRADALGQVVVRGTAAILLIGALLFRTHPDMRGAWPVMGIMAAAFAIAFIQLVPLPPALWLALPGHSMLADAAITSGQMQPWRPLSIYPGATLNALTSLIVPITTAFLFISTTKAERLKLPGIVLGLTVAMTIVGLLQFSRGGFNNPLVTSIPGGVSGTFANRNHFAVLLAIGCVLAPIWASLKEGQQWRWPVAFCVIIFFILMILASGSRVGLILSIFGAIIGLIAVRRQITVSFRAYPRWVPIVALSSGVFVLIFFITISFFAGRAASINRFFYTGLQEDMRALALPEILHMIGIYFPVGSGIGGFDATFRIHEPFELLTSTYFNHAHNDWLEIILDAGLPGALLSLVAVIWWGRASLVVWRTPVGASNTVAKLGSSLLLLVFGASIFDYPARTPIIMALIAIAGIWLGKAASPVHGTAPALRN